MHDDPRKTVIAGAGIAGLTAALALHRKGIPVRIFERAGSFDEVGAGIQLSPNATRLLDRLGAIKPLLPVAVRPEAVVVRDARSLRELARVPLGSGAEQRWGAPYLVVHRADLQSMLLARVRACGIAIETGINVADLAFHRRGTTLSVDRAGRIEEIGCGLVIGADGVWSALRAAVQPRSGERYSGQIAWRTSVPRGDGPAEEFMSLAQGDMVTTFVHPDFHLVCYPVRGGGTMNLVAVTKGAEPGRGWSTHIDPALLQEAMAGAADPLRSLARQAAPWTVWPLHTVDPRGRWFHPSGLALIGDAAHAMTPHAAQGAAMAIEDAAVLALALADARDDLPAALARYETLRRPRVRRVAARGAFNHFAWHARGPVALARNAVLRLRSPERLARDLDWLYGHDAEGT